MAVITISRQIGAGAWILGKRLSKRLGYRYVNENMIIEVARKGKISSGRVRVFEKAETTKLLKFLDKIVITDFIDRHISEKYGLLDEKRYVEMLRAIFQELHEKGNVVIIGRGGQYILKDYKNTYHILLVADLKDRIRLMMDEYRLTENEARRSIIEREKMRDQVLNLFSDPELQNDPISYDLVINTSRVPLEKAEKLVVQLISD